MKRSRADYRSYKTRASGLIVLGKYEKTLTKIQVTAIFSYARYEENLFTRIYRYFV